MPAHILTNRSRDFPHLIAGQLRVGLSEVSQPVKTWVKIEIPNHDAKGGAKVVRRQTVLLPPADATYAAEVTRRSNRSPM